MRFFLVLTLYTLLPMQSAWAGDIALQIGGHRVRAAITDTPHSRERGLMQSAPLCENCGMLFVFPQAGRYSFWMQDTPLPLAIAFIAADGSIIDIDEMQSNTTLRHSARNNFLYALEMNKGWFTSHAIKPGDRVGGLQRVPAGK